MLLSNVDSGLRLAVPTIVCAARCRTVSISYSFSARSTRSKSSTSPWTAVTAPHSGLCSTSEPGTRSRTRPTTLAPRCTSSRVVHAPRMPVQPVTNTLRSSQKLTSPHLPRRVAACPHVVVLDEVAVGVHALPEAGVPVQRQLPVGRQAGERRLLEHAVWIQPFEHVAPEDEESTAHDAVQIRFLAEAIDAAA